VVTKGKSDIASVTPADRGKNASETSMPPENPKPEQR
jgi:hypothetical protein